MVPSSLTLLVDVAAQVAWPVTQTLFHSLWIGLLVAACLWLLERIARRSSGENVEGGARPELPSRHRFTLSLAALTLVAASLPLGFSLVFDPAAFDEAVAATEHARDAVSESSANLLDARPITQVLDDARPTAGPGVGRLAEQATQASQANTWNDSTLQRIKAGTRRLAPAIAALYGAGVLVMLLRLAIGICGGRRLAKGGQRLTDSALMARLLDQATRLGVKLRPLVSTCERVAVPVVVGVIRPVILLPASLLSGLAPEDVETILTHELAHLRRRDHLTILVQRGLEAVLFYHPVAWWLGGRIDGLREHACDDLVLASGIDSLGYATTLLRVAELRTAAAEKRQLLSQLAVDGGHPSKLRRRIERIVEPSPDPGVRVRQSRSFVVALTVTAALAVALLPEFPVLSRTSATEDMSLVQALDFIEKATGVPITVSLGECMLRGVDGGTPVTIDVENVMARDLLDQVTQQAYLTYENTPGGIRVPATTPAFEFRIVPELPDSNARVRVPDDWREQTYADGTIPYYDHLTKRGFVWFPIQPSVGESLELPVATAEGQFRTGLLSDDSQNVLRPDGHWHVKDVSLNRDGAGERQLAVTVDKPGAERLRRLSRTALDHKLAILIHGVVVMAPTVRSEIGAKFVISGDFSDDQWRLIEKSFKQAMLPAGDGLTYECDVTDVESGEPIAGTEIVWRVRRLPLMQGEPPVFEQRFVTDEQGRYRVTLPHDVYEFAQQAVEFETSHRDYVPKNPFSVALPLPAAAESDFDLRHLKLRRGTEVTGRFLKPDGSPAANLRLMVSWGRHGPASKDKYPERITGYSDNEICRTDEDGYFRIITRPHSRKRLHWFPDDFVGDFVSLKTQSSRPAPITFGDQGTIRLQDGPRLTGRVVDAEGKPLPDFELQASTGINLPVRYATSDADGRFVFPPLRPGTYTVSPRDRDPFIYRKRDRKIREYSRSARPFDRVTVTLTEGEVPEILTIQQAPSRKVTIRALDDDDRPVSDAVFFAGPIENSLDVQSEPVSGSAGWYQLWVRDDEEQQVLRSKTEVDRFVRWQRATESEAVPGRSIVLDDQSSEVVARYCQAGELQLSFRLNDLETPPEDLHLELSYARAKEFESRGILNPRYATYISAFNHSRRIRHFPPDEDIIVKVRDGVERTLLAQKTVRVTAGQATYVTIDIGAEDETVPSSKNATDENGTSRPQSKETSGPVTPPKDNPGMPDPSATLKVRYRIPGSDDEARIFVERTGGTEGEIGTRGDGVMKWTPLRNGASFDLKKLIPGDYQVARMRQLEIVIEKDAKDVKRAQRIQTTVFLDRHRFSLKAGQQKTIDLSRKGGQRVTGTVARAADLKPARMVLYVCSPEAEGVDALHSLATTIFDAQQCNDGQFTTDLLEPGEYSLIAVGYDAWPKEAFFQTGFPRPGYAGRIKLRVPRDGQLKNVQIPLYRIHYPAGDASPGNETK